MTNFQKAFCVILSLCFFAVLALFPADFFSQGNIFRQLPLYCFLEDKARNVPQSEDPETLEKMIAANASYLGKRVEEENNKTKDNLPDENKNEEQSTAEQEQAEKTEEQNQETLEKTLLTEKPSENEREDQEDSSQKGKEDQAETSENENSTEEISSIRAAAASIQPHPKVDLSLEALSDYNYLLGQFFILDPNTATSAEQLNAAEFLGKDLTMEQNKETPQILIYHSHSQETFIDSREGVAEDSIVGVGDYLTKLLHEEYGYNVIHVSETFDIVNGQIDRSAAYDYSREYVEKVLKKYPSIEVIIDLHRDGVPEDRHLVTEINGKETAQIMFYNGLSYTVNNGPVEYLPNPYIQDNLAFSFQLEYQAALYYPDFYRGIYLAGLRYNLHLRPKAILLEAGAQTNTVQEVKNAMEPFADILDRVLRGENDF